MKTSNLNFIVMIVFLSMRKGHKSCLQNFGWLYQGRNHTEEDLGVDGFLY
jgi:hypothetical protein